MLVTIVALTGCATGSLATSEPFGSRSSVGAFQTPPPESASIASPTREATAGSALELLATLPVKGRAPRTGYDRDLFGQRWADVDRNGCDTRNDILARDLDPETFRPGTRECVVMTGVLQDPYTGKSLRFAKAMARAIQIDHVVALSDAWQKGAQAWSPDKRLSFANDPLNLLAVDGPTNARKSDGDAATWLPPNRAYRCRMVARQVAVKSVYGLWVTSAERDAMARVLMTCPLQGLPQGAASWSPVLDVAPGSESRPGLRTTAEPSTQGIPASDPDYGICAQAKASGAGPYTRDQPEYDYYRDGDGDGTVCE